MLLLDYLLCSGPLLANRPKFLATRITRTICHRSGEEEDDAILMMVFAALVVSLLLL